MHDRYVLSVWVSKVGWQGVASGKPLALQSASHPRLTDLELNLQGPYALPELSPEGCCRQQLYSSMYVNLLMWLHACCTDSPHPHTTPTPPWCWLGHPTGAPCLLRTRVSIHPQAEVANATCKWEIDTVGRKKHPSHMLVQSILWHSLSHFIASIWTSSPHHIKKTRCIYFTVSRKNNPLAKICTHPLKNIAKCLWFPSQGFFWKSDFLTQLVSLIWTC